MQQHQSNQRDALTNSPARNRNIEIAIELVMDAFSNTASHDEATEQALRRAGQLHAGEETAQIQEFIRKFGESMRRDSRVKTARRPSNHDC